MKKNKADIKPSKGFDRALAQCKPEDFDGHTEFHRLTPEQRLEWLAQTATFIHEFRGKAGGKKRPKATGKIADENQQSKH